MRPSGNGGYVGLNENAIGLDTICIDVSAAYGRLVEDDGAVGGSGLMCVKEGL